MTVKKIYISLLILALSLAGSAQVNEEPASGDLTKGGVRETSVFTEYADSVFGQTFETRPLDPEYHENDMISDFSIGDVKPEAYTAGLGTYDGTTQWKIDYMIGHYTVDIIDMNSLANGVADDTRCLRIKFAKGKFGILGSNSGNGGGAQWTVRIPAGHPELYLSYNLMRDENALPLREAKIPCLMGDFTFGNDNLGFRANSIMNRKEEFAQKWLVTLIDVAEIGEYWNDPETGGRWSWDWSDSIWYNITFRVSVNDPGQSNGLLEVFLNGKLSSSMSGLMITEKGYDVDRIMVHWFHGGNTEDFALERDAFMHLDDFYLFNYKDGYGLGPHEPSPWGRTLYNLPNWDISAGKKKEPGDAEQYDDTPPTKPENLTATSVTKYSIDIDWDASFDYAGVASYSIFINDQKAFSTEETSFHIGGLEADTQYEIYIKAVDISGNVSIKSDVIAQKTEAEDVIDPPPPPPITEDTIRPTAPSNLSARFVSDKTIRLDWGPSTDEHGIYYYVIYVNDKEIFTTPDTFMIVGFLQPSTEPIEAYIRAYDVNGNLSDPSNTLVYVVDAIDSEPPTAPGNLRSTYVSENTISLEWDGSVDNQGVREYLIYLNGKFWESSSRTEETVAHLEAGLPYKIQVTAIDDAGNNSDESNEIEVTTKNSDNTVSPTFPDISIVEVLDEVKVPQVTSEMSSLGFIELENFGLEVVENDDPSSGSIIMDGVGSTKVINENRVEKGLQLFYNFTEGEESSVIEDLSGVDPPMNLFIDREGLATKWLPGKGLRVQDETSLEYLGKSSRLLDSLRKTNEITIEVWLKQEDLHQQPGAQIFSLAGDQEALAATLSQTGTQVYYNYSGMLNTSAAPDGNPALNTGYNFTSLSLHHVIFTHNSLGEERLYINGIELSVGNRAGDFSSWEDAYGLILCNDKDGGNYWTGILYLVSVYNRALSQEEVLQNFNSQSGNIQFTNELSQLEKNVEYLLTPFIVSSQGLVYGDPEIFIRETVTEKDSLFSFYPNPNSGEIQLLIHNGEGNTGTAYLRLADYSGNTLYTKEVELTGFLTQEELINLPDELPEGEYIISLIAGSQYYTEKLLLLRH